MRTASKAGLRILYFLLAVILILPLVLPVSAVAGTHSVSAASVYRRATSSSSVVGQVADGTALKVLGKSGHYYKLDCGSMKGYIHESHVSYSDTDGYVAVCDSDRKDSGSFTQYSASQAFELQASLMEMSASFLGTPYVYGGSSPWGFDCSGFVSYLYKQHDIQLHRCADAQMQDGLIVSRDNLRVGDLVFFSIEGPWVASHVGIYVGNGQMIHSANGGVHYSSLDADYWDRYYVGARRILSVNQEQNTGKTSIQAIAIDMVLE
jgi:hypothetical protein